MAVFDQRGQHVMYQYNARGDINFGAVQNRMSLAVELQKLQAEMRQAIKSGVIEGEMATDAQYHLDKATHEAQKPAPDKKKLIDYLDTAKTTIAGIASVAGLVTALTKAAELVEKLL